MKCNEMNRNSQRIVATFVVAIAFIAAKGVQAIQVELLGIDGKTVKAEWVGAEPLSIKTSRTGSASDSKAFPLEMLSRVSFAANEKPATGGLVFFLADGGRLGGEIVKGGADRITAKSSLGEMTIPFTSLAAIQFCKESESEKAATVFNDAMAARLPGQDILISRDADEVKSVRGTLEKLDEDEGSFRFADKSRIFQMDKIFGIVFASGAGEAARGPLAVHLTTGDIVTGSLQSGDAAQVEVKSSFGAVVTIPLAEIDSIDVHSDLLTYVSELTPIEEHVEGVVHDPWPVRRDRSASNTPISMAGRTFARGLGVHCKTTLSYDLGGAYESLIATIGLDDVVRPRGAVVFRVLGDGKMLFDSGLVRGTDPPRDIQVPLEDVKKVTLVVDYGEGLDIAGQADWGGARLIKAQNVPNKRRM